MTEREPLSWRLVLTDVVALTVLSALALSPLSDAFAGSRWVVAAVGGLAIGVGVTLVARRLSWGPLLTALLTLATYGVTGPALATPSRAIGGVLPGPGAEHDLIVGTVDGWRNAVTLPLDLGSGYGAMVVPLVTALLGTLWATTFLWRSRWPSIGAFGVVAMFATAATFGARATDLPLARGLLLALGLLVWVRWRALRTVRTSWTRRIALTAAVVAFAGVAGAGLTVAAPGSGTREVLRDHVNPPLQDLAFKSPLSKYRNYYLKQGDQTLFTVDGMPDGARIRLATMDAFNGIVWNVSTIDQDSGSSAFKRAPGATGTDTVTVTIGDYTGPWLPTIGGAKGATLTTGAPDGRQLLINPDTGAVAQLGDVKKGDVYTIDWSPSGTSVAPDANASADRSVAFPRPSRRLPQLEKLVQTWIAKAGASSDMAVAQAVSDAFQQGYYSDGKPDDKPQVPSGHGARRIADLIADPSRMIGNDEQYASAMALAMQNLGMPARVVLGFEPDAGPAVTGADIAAWVEIRFRGAGWVAFDPTPSTDRVPTQLQQDPNPKPQPNVIQPPVLPQEPADVEGTPPEGAQQALSHRIWELILRILGYVWTATKILLLLSPLWGLLLVKRIRRKRRRRAADPIDRLSGGWRELTDRARDLGTTLPYSNTRYESSVVLAERYPEAALPTLATLADRHVFGPVDPTPEEVDAYWVDVNTALKRMRKAAPFWRRPLAWFSPASIPWRDVRAGARARVVRSGRRLAGSRVGRLVGRGRRRLVATFTRTPTRKKDRS